MLDVARVRHKYRGDVFHAAATGLDGSGKESRSIAVARLRGALLHHLKLGDLFGRMSSMPADRSVAIQWPDSGRAPVSADQNPAANPGSSASGVSSQQAGRSGSGGASNRTVVIQWPNNNGAPPSTNQPSAPSSAPNPPARAVQQPASGATGRSDRTVIIQWPDSGQSPPPRN